MWMALLDRMLKQVIRKGSLTLHAPNGRTYRYGDETGEPVTVRLLDPTLPRRIVQSPDLGVGEGYMDGGLTFDGDDLRGFMRLAVRNSEWVVGVPWHRSLDGLRYLRGRLRQYTPTSRARRNVAHHYDLSGELYDLFLDSDKQYSCAYFRSPDDSLEQAQAQKKAHIAAKLALRPGMRVLDIGCGWGGMALTLARDHGAQVLGITLSEEQHRTATRRAAEAGLQDRVSFRLCDYREVEGRFDRVVSVGMFEHVGAPQYGAYFRQVSEKLTVDGIALIQTIGRTTPPGTNSPWIEKYIFPGGYIPALSEMTRAIERANLLPTDIEVWRLHYAETIRHWLDRFEANIERARALYDERFCRMWRYYLAACEQTFRMNRQVVYQVQLARSLDAVPLTRDYLHPRPEATQPLEQVAAE
ncbi:SAM-dependent methyltransferase [Roseitranquillus sediminis]|uniref:SAM-dependent methyltransferase n=1 Tax=Roseitranquillus sediminis TaxID=2809051 RepID=UPI001D0C9E02|nr:cyclopropane-fatty-acyl-phospholipid synthase family protein [Roseitranquillus sediminis]MBM9595777.1 class I SAM-dependent methyltransferase [Roseitranquillus sediminis]